MDMNIMMLMMKQSNIMAFPLLCSKFQLKISLSQSFIGIYVNNALYLFRSKNNNKILLSSLVIKRHFEEIP